MKRIGPKMARAIRYVELRFYIPELWIHTRAIVQEKTSGLKCRFRIRRITYGSSKDSTYVELVPTNPHPEYPDACVELSLTKFEESFEPCPRP